MAQASKKPRKKATNGYSMPEPLPKGEILTDIAKTRWKLGPSIGKGGFGEIYAAQDASKSSSKYPFVIKVEPHGNGPLFVEMHFYMKNAKQADIDAFKQKHKLKRFGMPAYLGSGSHEVGAAKYRFIVMEKFGVDVDKLREKNKGALPEAVVYQLAWQISYTLEYIHETGYVHADIKGGNVLLGDTTENKNQAYLVDFGLAGKFTTDKEFKPNPKKAHDGTIEYLSRDAHHGVPTRRGDFEILGYNIIHWLGGSLPWDSKLENPKTVQQLKEESWSDIPGFVKKCLKKNHQTLTQYLQYVDKLKHNERPDYKKIRSWFENEVQKNGGRVDGPLQLQGAQKRKSTGEEDLAQMQDSEDEDVVVKKTVRRKKKPQEIEEVVTTEVMTEAMKEVMARIEKKGAKKKQLKNKENKKTEVPETNGYTAEMLEIKKKMDDEKVAKRKPRTSPATEGGRMRRNLPEVNYDERNLKSTRSK
jgi:vaccinia related kinase